MMNLNGLHILLTYQCSFECDHCFVWGSPWQTGTFTVDQVTQTLNQAREVKSIEWVYFEGGEPFLYYPVLLQSVRTAVEMGFKVGIVTNSYWALSPEDARIWLEPFKGLIDDLSVSTDLYHFSEQVSKQSQYAQNAAETLRIPIGLISVAPVRNCPPVNKNDTVVGQLPIGDSGVMFRGRAVQKLVNLELCKSWEIFTSCPYEDLRDPGRVHLDPLGNVHICQGISIGNIFQESLRNICEKFDPDRHPIIGPLLAGGPARLVSINHLAHDDIYADACHLCYSARLKLREKYPDILLPDQMYGIYNQ